MNEDGSTDRAGVSMANYDRGEYLFRTGSGSMAVQVDTLLCTALDWSARPERSDPSWLVRPILGGGHVLAVRVVL